MKSLKKFVGIDLFAGAGGLSLGAKMAGIDVILAVECDKYAAETYSVNHPEAKMDVRGIEEIRRIKFPKNSRISSVIFGGPPCQGFSTSNQKTRNRSNPNNWLFREFIRVARISKPDWIVLENVPGLLETENGLFYDSVVHEFEELGYTCTSEVLCAADFGVPQKRFRFFLVGSRHGVKIRMPKKSMKRPVTVRQAISDLPSLKNGANTDFLVYPCAARCKYAHTMRQANMGCTGNLVSKNSPLVIKRYGHVPQGGNWADIPARLMSNYTDRSRCHTGIYRRLNENSPSVVLGNYRKSMLIHPWEDRGLSVREAARLQSFPDWYKFQGSIGFQQQQVGNAVPPLLAKAVFETIVRSEV